MRDWSRVPRLAAVVAVIFLLGNASVRAANWFEMNTGIGGPRFDAEVPLCDTPFALATIQSRFLKKESGYWASTLEIVRFDKVREVAFRPWADNTIPRRFCQARALTSDGLWRPVHYSIIEDGGFFGATWGVQWCVVGADRNWANNPACRQAMP
jgi:hypothetical protein